MRLARLVVTVLGLCAAVLAQEVRETWFATTSDGVSVAVHRVRPAQLVVGREPVLCMPGFIENHRIYDLDSRHSLAGYLAQAGLDVWILEYRGVGDSWKPRWWQVRGWRFSVDDFMHQDVPAAVDLVLRRTGSRTLFLLGHSMGGLNAYGYCATETGAQTRVRGIVTLAGAGRMSVVPSMRPLTVILFMLSRMLEPFMPWDIPLPTGVAFQLLAQMPILRDMTEQMLMGAIGSVVWSTSNMNPALVRTMLRWAIGDISMNVPKQFLRWIGAQETCTFGPSPWWDQPRRSRWYEANGFMSYTDALRRIRVPALVMVGGDDQIVPRENCLYCFRRLRSADKTFVVVERGNGSQVDVGHEDILVGDQSPIAVFPTIRWWLLDHATR